MELHGISDCSHIKITFYHNNANGIDAMLKGEKKVLDKGDEE